MHNRLKKSPENTVQPKATKPNKPQPQPKPPKVLSKEELESKFTTAADDGDIELVKELLKQGVDINFQTPRGYTAFINAASNNQKIVVEELLKVPGIDVNICDNNKNTALHWASFGMHKGTVQILLNDKRVDVNAKDDNLNSAISNLISKDNEEIIDLFLQHRDLDLNYLNKYGTSPLWSAISKKNEKLVAKFLQHKGIDVNLHKSLHPLLNALYSGNKNIFHMVWNHPKVDRSVINEEALNWLKNNDPESDSDDEIDPVVLTKYKQEIFLMIKNPHLESHADYEVLGVSTDDSSDTHSNLSGNLSFESPEEILVESADEAEITGAKEQSLADFLA